MTPGPLAERAHTEQEFRSGTRSRALGHFCTQEWAASPARFSQVVGEAGGLCRPSQLSMPEGRPWQLAPRTSHSSRWLRWAELARSSLSSRLFGVTGERTAVCSPVDEGDR